MAAYIDKLNADEQISTEEAIAARLFEAVPGMSEEDCADAGRDILQMVLAKFRPDLLAPAEAPAGDRSYNVVGTVTLPIGFCVQVDAKTPEEAEEKARNMLATRQAYIIHDFDGNKVGFSDDDIDVDDVYVQ